MSLLRSFYEDYGRRLGGRALRTFDEVERAVQRRGHLTRYLARVWPTPRPDDVVRRVLSTRSVLSEAAEGILDPDEQTLLVRRGRELSEADLPLLDEARALLGGPPPRFGHVIVDEAQDLTPMQLRMVGRRIGGSFTILGDVAQATGPVSYGRWEELLPHLPGGDESEVAELRHAYRVPREIMGVALPLLAEIAPHVEPPVAYRSGAEPPLFLRADPPLPRALEEAGRLGREEGLVAVIAPPSLAGAAPGSLFDETRVPVLTPREAKGLEFDHVVVVEPCSIVSEAAPGQGLRELYVALTRPTRTLVVVHALPLPDALRA
jgi:superfamily I DNA/RNA helicase